MSCASISLKEHAPAQHPGTKHYQVIGPARGHSRPCEEFSAFSELFQRFCSPHNASSPKGASSSGRYERCFEWPAAHAPQHYLLLDSSLAAPHELAQRVLHFLRARDLQGPSSNGWSDAVRPDSDPIRGQCQGQMTSPSGVCSTGGQ